ncbi:MAG: deoxyguanosinetriphosphate triphosphohydrolase [Acetobacterales bacterium]
MPLRRGACTFRPMTLRYSDLLASYASRAESSRGRLIGEPESETRSPFQRDRDRIIHSTAFRRLKQKTQVFVYHEGDHYRTRLTHSIEVAQISRSISRALGLNEDLAEAVALAHDLGHPPFGHAGEEALDRCLRPFGGFDHNAQTLRIVTVLEHRYADFQGLNLSWETLEGVVKHNGPIAGEAHWIIADYDRIQSLWLGSQPGPEAQVAALCDDIAYTSHDIDDGLRAGLITREDLRPLPCIGTIAAELEVRYPDLDPRRFAYEAVRRFMNVLVNDLLAESRSRIEAARVGSADDVRRHDGAVVAFSNDLLGDLGAIKKFLFENLYRHYKVNRMTSKARRVVRDLFDLLLAEPNCLPTHWQRDAGAPGSPETARLVGDYIAGMTDRFAIDEHRRLFDLHHLND